MYYVLGNSEEILTSHENWKIYFKNHPDNVLRIYIFNEDSLSKYGTCEVLEKQILMKRFDLSYDDLEKIKWRVVFDKPGGH